jgi:hypothetical protein
VGFSVSSALELTGFSDCLATSDGLGPAMAAPKSAVKGSSESVSSPVCFFATSGDPGPAVVDPNASEDVPKALARASLATAGALGSAVVESESCGWRVSAASRGVTSSAEGSSTCTWTSASGSPKSYLSSNLKVGHSSKHP